MTAFQEKELEWMDHSKINKSIIKKKMYALLFYKQKQH